MGTCHAQHSGIGPETKPVDQSFYLFPKGFPLAILSSNSGHPQGALSEQSCPFHRLRIRAVPPWGVLCLICAPHLISSLLALFSRNCTKDSVPAGRADLIPNPSRLFLGFCCILNSSFVLSDDSISIPRLTIRFYLIRLFDAYEPFDREISSGAFQTRDSPFAPRLDSCPHFLVLRPIVGGPHLSLTHESLVRRGSVSHRERNSCSQTFPHLETHRGG